jgi:hypothetical protein
MTMHGDGDEILWTRPPDLLRTARIGRWLAWPEAYFCLGFSNYHGVWESTVEDFETLGRSVWNQFELIADAPPEREFASDTTWKRPCPLAESCARSAKDVVRQDSRGASAADPHWQPSSEAASKELLADPYRSTTSSSSPGRT